MPIWCSFDSCVVIRIFDFQKLAYLWSTVAEFDVATKLGQRQVLRLTTPHWSRVWAPGPNISSFPKFWPLAAKIVVLDACFTWSWTGNFELFINIADHGEVIYMIKLSVALLFSDLWSADAQSVCIAGILVLYATWISNMLRSVTEQLI